MSYSRYSALIVAGVLLAVGIGLIDRPAMEEYKYAIRVEWYDDIAALMRQFTFFYYPSDSSVEMYDIKQRKTFLRKTPCYEISENELFIGNSIKVFSRDLKILEYLDAHTMNALQRKAERTYAMLKPEVVNQMGQVLAFIESRGFRFNRMMLTHISSSRVAEFYQEHRGRPFYDGLVNYISSGPVLAMELLAPSAVASWRKTLGPTDSEKARIESPNSLRALFGLDTTNNAAHGSDSIESAARELALIFNYQSSYVDKAGNYTLCLIKPHVLMEGKLGQLIAQIQGNGFKVAALKIIRIQTDEAERFFQSYRGVWEDYPAHIKHYTSAPAVAVAIASDVNSFREFVGPFDPEIARKLRPTTLRGQFGRDLPHNAVHCTDLPEDGEREVGFFFKELTEIRTED